MTSIPSASIPRSLHADPVESIPLDTHSFKTPAAHEAQANIDAESINWFVLPGGQNLATNRFGLEELTGTDTISLIESGTLQTQSLDQRVESIMQYMLPRA